jgi:transcriptional regulator with XRE-family HTH domain
VADADVGRGSFAERLDHLFEMVRPKGGRPYSMDVVAERISEQGTERVSAAYLWALRRGVRDNPTLRTIEALARFFGVPTAYFFDDDVARRVDSQLELATKMRDAGVADIKLRSADLTPESRAAIAKMLDIASAAMAEMMGVVAGAGASGQGAADEEALGDSLPPTTGPDRPGS